MRRNNRGYGEDGEGFNIVRLQNPFASKSGGLIQLGGGIALTDAKAVKSSWNAVLNGDFRKSGRVGYSVKFISFDSLVGKRSSTDGSTSWTNTMPGDTDDTDWPSIRH